MQRYNTTHSPNPARHILLLRYPYSAHTPLFFSFSIISLLLWHVMLLSWDLEYEYHHLLSCFLPFFFLLP